MKVQIIGKVTHLRREDAEAKFAESEWLLESFGHEVVNPMKIVPPDATHAEAMRICLRSLLEVEAVAIQPDWSDSKGAKIEYMVACALELFELPA